MTQDPRATSRPIGGWAAGRLPGFPSRARLAAMTEPSLQEMYAPAARCFGCGPANVKGLRIRSIAASSDADAHVVCDFLPELHHEAFENVLNGGIIGTVLDCHMNWTAIHHLMR